MGLGSLHKKSGVNQHVITTIIIIIIMDNVSLLRGKNSKQKSTPLVVF